MGVQPPYRSTWERDAESGWHAITITCVLILLACGGLGLLLLLARHHADQNNSPVTPLPAVTTTGPIEV